MKFFLLVYAVTIVGGSEAHNIHLTQSQKDRFHLNALQCMKESGVKPDVVSSAKKGEFSDDKAFKEFLLCVFQKSEIVTKDGKLDVNTTLTKLPPGADAAAVKKVLEECKDKNGSSKADMVFEIFKCYYSKTPTHIIVF